ncbi:MAG TPA: hypothetical protein VGD55_06370 [Acidothermaceae bacterium]
MKDNGLFRLVGFAPTVAVCILAACQDVRVDPFAREARPDTGATTSLDAGRLACPPEMIGFASVSGSTQPTTGGGTARPVTVSTLSDLVSEAGSVSPAVIVIKGMVVVPPASQPLQIEVGSNKTIVGADASSGLTGGGFIIDATRNVIIRNLVISFPVGTDGIAVQAAQHVWIDHCELYSDTNPGRATDYYGWLVNIKHASDFVTVSWTRFHDHFNTAQIGHSDDNSAEDLGHLTVTYHHNLFERTHSGSPRVRFGTVHVFNNDYDAVSDYAVASQDQAQVRVEQNYFQTVAEPLTNTHEMTPPGAIGDILNTYSVDSGPNVLAGSGAPAFTLDALPYPFMTDSTSSVRAIVSSCAGPGRI